MNSSPDQQKTLNWGKQQQQQNGKRGKKNKYSPLRLWRAVLPSGRAKSTGSSCFPSQHLLISRRFSSATPLLVELPVVALPQLVVLWPPVPYSQQIYATKNTSDGQQEESLLVSQASWCWSQSLAEPFWGWKYQVWLAFHQSKVSTHSRNSLCFWKCPQQSSFLLG